MIGNGSIVPDENSDKIILIEPIMDGNHYCTRIGTKWIAYTIVKNFHPSYIDAYINFIGSSLEIETVPTIRLQDCSSLPMQICGFKAA
jgi:hypothetical protein